MSVPGNSLQPDVHSPLALVQKNLPNWLHNTSQDSLVALKSTALTVPDWIKNASSNQQLGLKKAINAHWTAFNKAEKQLGKILTPDAFAEPLLKEALKPFGLDLDVRNTYIRLYVPLTTPFFPIQTGASKVWAVSLLDAALHNFELSETTAGAYEEDSFYTTAPLTDEQYAGQYTELPDIKKKLSIEGFTALCRTLDIGAKYEAFLRENLGFTEPVVDAVLRPLIRESHQTALIWALEQALAKKDIEQPLYNALRESLDTGSDIVVDGKTWSPYSLAMLDCNLTEIIIFGARCEARSADLKAYAPSTPEGRIVVYIPDDLEHSLKEYASPSAFYTEMVGRLRALPFQQFLSRFISHKDRGAFFTALPAELDHKVFFPATPAQWQEPTLRPRLKMASEEIVGSLWDYLFETQMSRRLDNGMDVAVSTARTDQRVRWRRWETFVTVVKTIAEIGAFVVAPFFPPLGAVMLGYTAYQLLDEVFEGIIDWSLGLTTQAFEHLVGVIEAMAQLGGFIVGAPLVSAAARALLPAEVTAFFENLSQVKLKNGQSRLWNGDMRPYEHEMPLDNDSEPDDLGLHRQGGKTILPLESKHYVVEQNPTTAQHHVTHPTRESAYKPGLNHNGVGAWQHENETPVHWDRQTLLRRLGGKTSKLPITQAEQALHISGLHEDVLRNVHVNNARPPALLSDSLGRFAIDQTLSRFIEQMKASDLSADPQRQLQLLTQDENWPKTKVLRFIDGQGRTIKEYGNGLSNDLPRVQIANGQLQRGDLLKTVLESLDENDTRTLLGNNWKPTLPERLVALREKLAQQAQAKRIELFDSHYASTATSQNRHARLLQEQILGLPRDVAEELIGAVNGREMKRMLATDRLPLRVLEEARLYAQEVRLSRAYEGLYLDTGFNPDTETLVLRTLGELPGWPKDLRLEVRRENINGRLLESIGPTDVKVRRILLRDGNQYETRGPLGEHLHGADNLYAAVLHALPDAQRIALGFPSTGQKVRLQKWLQDHALSRTRLREVLDMPRSSPSTSPMKLAKDREGYSLLDDFKSACKRAVLDEESAVLSRSPRCTPPRSNAFRTLAKELYPNKTPIEVEAFLNLTTLADKDALGVLRQLKKEYRLLKAMLHEWEWQPATATVAENQQMLVQQSSKTRVVQRMLACWRRETEMVLDDEGANVGNALDLSSELVGEMPTLTANFHHVGQLKVSHAGLSADPSEFLAAFPAVRDLDLSGNSLRAVPSTVGHMTGLERLTLDDNQIRMSEETASRLTRLIHLQVLTLDNNPLGSVPDLSAIRGLRQLWLRNTRLSEWPANLHQLTRLHELDLRANQLTTVPDALFTLRGARANGIHLHDNPLSEETLVRINDHFLEHFIDFGVSTFAHAPEPATADPWLRDVDPALHAYRRQQWNDLEAEPDASALFSLLNDLTESAPFISGSSRPAFSDEIWQMLDAMTKDTELRNQLFAIAENDAEVCGDGALGFYGNLRLAMLAHQARLVSGTEGATAGLLKLAKGQFRLQEVDTLARVEFNRQIEARLAARIEEFRQEKIRELKNAELRRLISNGASGISYDDIVLSQKVLDEITIDPERVQRARQIIVANSEEVEVILAYRNGLATRLDLPGQSGMAYQGLSGVTTTMLGAAGDEVERIEAQEPQRLVASIADEPFWIEHLKHRYEEDFRAIEKKFADKGERLDDFDTAQRQLASTNKILKQQQELVKTQSGTDQGTATALQVTVLQARTAVEKSALDTLATKLAEEYGVSTETIFKAPEIEGDFTWLDLAQGGLLDGKKNEELALMKRLTQTEIDLQTAKVP